MKTSKLLLAGLVISQAVAFPALAKKTMAEIQALCKGNKFESICIKAMIEQEGLADEPSAPVEPTKPVVKPTKPVEKDEDKMEVVQPAQPSTDKDPIQFGFMHTKQDCHVVENGIEHKPTFCMMTDTQAATDMSGMVAAINAQLDTVKDKAATAKVSVAYFSFSNKPVQAKLCELSKAGVQIRMFLDAGGGPPGGVEDKVMNNPDCRDSKGRLNVKLSYLGGSTSSGAGGIWRLHHNKFLMIDPGDGGKVKFNFSSGNLSSFGTSLHLDHWVTTEASASSNLIRAQRCVMQGLEAASQIADGGQGGSANEMDQAIAQGYISAREKCFDQNNVLPRVSGGNVDSQIAKILEKEEIAPLFSPNNNSYVERAFISAVGKIPSKGYLYIAIQHFLHGGVKNALLSAAERGVDVRLIMDDDALKGESEVPGVDAMIKSLISQSGGRIQIRLAETNAYTSPPNKSPAMMHNKLAILNGEMSFSGAGHYTNAALRDNWENFYFVTDKGVLASYAKYFKYLWSQSVDVRYSESNGKVPSQAPSALSPAFSKLAQ